MQRFMPAVPNIRPNPSRIQPPPIPIKPDDRELAIAPMNIIKASPPAIESAAAAAVIAKPVRDITNAKANITTQRAVITGNQTGNVSISKISLAIFSVIIADTLFFVYSLKGKDAYH